MKFESDFKQLSPIFILRLGVGFAFVYAGINALLYPTAWLYFVPSWLSAIIPAGAFLTIYAIFELVLGFAIFFGRFLSTASMLAFWNLIFILIFYGLDDVTFRDFGIALAALALFFISLKAKERKRDSSQTSS